MPFIITKQSSLDVKNIQLLIENAFGIDRHKRIVYQFRKSIAHLPDLCFIANHQDKLVGSIEFWPVKLPNQQIIPLLGPLAVDSDWHGKGVGRALVKYGIDAVKAQGFNALIIVGDPIYYAPFGFNIDVVDRLKLPGDVTPLTFMGVEFKAQSLANLSGNILPIKVA